MAKLKREGRLCEAGEQVTTHEQASHDEPLKCLCREGARYRSEKENEAIKNRPKRSKLNFNF